MLHQLDGTKKGPKRSATKSSDKKLSGSKDFGGRSFNPDDSNAHLIARDANASPSLKKQGTKSPDSKNMKGKNGNIQNILPDNDPDAEFMILADLIDFGQDQLN